MLDDLIDDIRDYVRCGLENDDSLRNATNEEFASDIMAYCDHFWQEVPDEYEELSQDEQRAILTAMIATVRA